MLDRVGAAPKVFVLDFSNVPLIDITAANTLRGFVRKLARSETQIYFVGARPTVRRTLRTAGFEDGVIRFADTPAAALQQIKPAP